MRTNRQGLAMIELLISLALVAVLFAITLPNFMDKQIRSRVAGVRTDLRRQVLAVEAYRVDRGQYPPPFNGRVSSRPEWWGFMMPLLTTPVAYLPSLPVDAFPDRSLLAFWRAVNGGKSDGQPCTYIYDPVVITFDNLKLARSGAWSDYPAAGAAGLPNPYMLADGLDFFENLQRSVFVIYSTGPDQLNGSVWIRPSTYDPSNGTMSFGDIHAFGVGDYTLSGVSINRQGRNIPQN